MDCGHRRTVGDDANPKIAETASVDGEMAAVADVGVDKTSLRADGFSTARFVCSTAGKILCISVACGRLDAAVGRGVESGADGTRAARGFGAGIPWEP